MSPRLQKIFPVLRLLGVLSLLHCPPGLCGKYRGDKEEGKVKIKARERISY